MKRAMTAWLLGLVVFVGAAAPAAAWTKFKNNSANTIWAAHAHSSVTGLFCGWPDACSGSGKNDWRVAGYWVIAPGGTAIVHPAGYGNAMHDVYADDAFGHVWGGGGNTFCIGFEGFDHCGGNCGVDPTSSNFEFARARGTRCCGGSCPGNGTINFNP